MRTVSSGMRVAAVAVAVTWAVLTMPDVAAAGGGGGSGHRQMMTDGQGGGGVRGLDQDRLRELDQLRDRIHNTNDPAERQRLMRTYRQRIDQDFKMMRRGQGPGPNASDAERLRYMENRTERMQRLMNHMWEYENRMGAGDE
ncbi:hypothetical protein [Arhodomonas aquaeolei]|uniref:hypothetical protein n=1 Tax=Arhodomonas aquaeolei TaxID=2369 RepID=UPI0003741A04|nr:hypothetical protein [Arhodomonas aquaeolei]